MKLPVWAWLALMLGAGLWVAGCKGDDDDTNDDDVDDDSADDDSSDDDTDDDDADDDDDDDTTGDDPVVAQDMVDRVYFLDLTTGTYDPTQIETTMQTVVPTDEGVVFAAGAIDEGSGEITMRLGWGSDDDGGADWEGWIHDTTEPTFEEMGTWSNPRFEVGPIEVLYVTVGAVSAYVGNVTLSGKYVVDGSEVQDGTMSGWLDSTAFDALQGQPNGFTCQVMEAAGHPCEVCPSGPLVGQEICLPFTASALVCPELEDLVIEAR